MKSLSNILESIFDDDSMDASLTAQLLIGKKQMSQVESSTFEDGHLTINFEGCAYHVPFFAIPYKEQNIKKLTLNNLTYTYCKTPYPKGLNVEMNKGSMTLGDTACYLKVAKDINFAGNGLTLYANGPLELKNVNVNLHTNGTYASESIYIHGAKEPTISNCKFNGVKNVVFRGNHNEWVYDALEKLGIAKMSHEKGFSYNYDGQFFNMPDEARKAGAKLNPMSILPIDFTQFPDMEKLIIDVPAITGVSGGRYLAGSGVVIFSKGSWRPDLSKIKAKYHKPQDCMIQHTGGWNSFFVRENGFYSYNIPVANYKKR